MRLTNKFALPEAFVRAVERDPYDSSGPKGDTSASKLPNPPQISYLWKHHWHEIEEDVSERVYALFGQTTHTVLERAAEPNALKEQRLFADYAGWKVSGQYDRMVLHPDYRLSDYKVTSVWTIVYGGRPEWTQQLNVLADLAIRNGYDVRALEVVVFFRDWSARKANEDKYPSRPVEAYPIELWPAGKRLAYIEERVALHQQAVLGNPAPCTPEERWYKGDTFAVIKAGQKRAMRGGIFGTEDFARAFADSWNCGKKPSDPVAEVHRRPGEYTRCESYCAVGGKHNWCAQWVKDRDAKADSEDPDVRELRAG